MLSAEIVIAAMGMDTGMDKGMTRVKGTTNAGNVKFSTPKI